jgi:hypothetical protein
LNIQSKRSLVKIAQFAIAHIEIRKAKVQRLVDHAHLQQQSKKLSPEMHNKNNFVHLLSRICRPTAIESNEPHTNSARGQHSPMTPLQIRLTFTNRNNVNKENTKQTKKSTRVLFDWRTRHSIGHNVSSAARRNWQRHLTRLLTK